MERIRARIEAETAKARTATDEAMHAWHLGIAAGLAEAAAGKIDMTMYRAFDDYANGYLKGLQEYAAMTRPDPSIPGRI